MGNPSYGREALPRNAYFFSSASTSGASFSGVTPGSKRLTISPLRLMRNLVKFHLMSPANFGSVSLEERYLYKGVMPSPLTPPPARPGQETLYSLAHNS